MHCCKKCFSAKSPEVLYALTKGERERHFARIAVQQKWDLSEPALQLLILPLAAKEPLPKYASQPTYLNPSHCRLCLQEVTDLEKHLQDKHSPEAPTLQEYRRKVLREVVHQWPEEISPQVLRCRLAAFKEAMSDENFEMLACASCARQKRRCKLQQVTFPAPNEEQCPAWLPWSAEEWVAYRETWYEQVDDIFNIESYLRIFFKTQERLASAMVAVASFENEGHESDTFPSKEIAECWLRRVEKWVQNLRKDLRSDSVEAPGDSEKRWLLFKSATLNVKEETKEISCLLCKHCRHDLSAVSADSKKKPKLKMPMRARANGLWHGPDPPELEVLSYCECKVINLARIYVSVKRVFLDREGFAGTSKSEAPLYHQKNVVAYPQNPDAALRNLGVNPQTLAKTLLVQFVGGDRQLLRFHPDLQVSVQKLQKAFLWLSENSWPFMEATKTHSFEEGESMDTALRTLLQQYASSVGGDVGGVPAEILQGATQIPEDRASVVLRGPANCTEEDAQDMGDSDKDKADDNEVQCAAALDGGLDDFGPVQLWDSIMKKYKISQVCGEELARLDAVKDKTKIEILRQQQAVAVAEAVQGISDLNQKDIKKKLLEFATRHTSGNNTMVISHDEQFLRTNDPMFWPMCFMRLFARGDCAEKCSERRTHLPALLWAKTLLTRADFSLWRLDVEFVACLYNVNLRRDQMRAVEAYCTNSRFDAGQVDQIRQLTAAGLVANALASGDVNSVRAVLRKKNLEQPIEKAMRSMQIQQRSVRGSEGERDGILHHFLALRLWSGCSSLFFTLNPHDIRSPLTLLLLQEDFQLERKFSLDFTDQEAAEYMKDFLHQHPRRLHELVARDPLVATRVFHWTVRLVIKELFHCDIGGHADTIPAQETPGIFGHVRAFHGVVEPQMRKALHIHMLVQLVGFMHPDDLLRKGGLVDTFKRVWRLVASVCFRSTEAFAHYLHCDGAMEALREAPLLPLTQKQRGMIGEQRVRESSLAQLQGRGLKAAIVNTRSLENLPFYPSSQCANKSVDADAWSAFAVREVQHRTQKTGNHVCKAAVCHKGSIGRKGFCRMFFWHWSRFVDQKKEIAKRMHGLQLHRRWNGTGLPPVCTNPPHIGLPAIETNHPFHFKMTPAMLMGPQCNHDLGILLRICSMNASMDSLNASQDLLCLGFPWRPHGDPLQNHGDPK